FSRDADRCALGSLPCICPLEHDAATLTKAHTKIRSVFFIVLGRHWPETSGIICERSIQGPPRFLNLFSFDRFLFKTISNDPVAMRVKLMAEHSALKHAGAVIVQLFFNDISLVIQDLSVINTPNVWRRIILAVVREPV